MTPADGTASSSSSDCDDGVVATPRLVKDVTLTLERTRLEIQSRAREHRQSAIGMTLPAEVLLECFGKLDNPSDLFAAALTCRAWASCCVELLWARPALSSMLSVARLTKALATSDVSYDYSTFVRRVNVAHLHGAFGDAALTGFLPCSRLERLVLAGCSQVSESTLCQLIENNRDLVSLDVSDLLQITDRLLICLSQSSANLQGLNLSGCPSITDDAVILVANHCPELRRIKLSRCVAIADRAIDALAQSSRNLLELDIEACLAVTPGAVCRLLSCCKQLRDLKLSQCTQVTDLCFTSFPRESLASLRMIDVTGCSRLTDMAVYHIVTAAPKLRSLAFTRCVNLTDRGVVQISRLGKYLHHLHLGHCSNLTDRSITFLVRYCSRLRYIDLACCYNLSDVTVTSLGSLARVKRIGLVKCAHVTNESIISLASKPLIQASLERIHLSYCTNLTLESIAILLNACPQLTHISLTGVLDFLRHDLIQFCRPAPRDFNVNQAAVFCVFSGPGVGRLRAYLNAGGAIADDSGRRRPAEAGARIVLRDMLEADDDDVDD
ncbi:SCF ubiquitin ligase complex subunit [Savitreella phatthalungensis]